MRLAGRGGGVKFSGGTYSGHPGSMLASVTMMERLVSVEPELYPRIAALATRARTAVEQAFAAHGMTAKCTGGGSNAIPDSSLAAVQFPYGPSAPCDSPDQTRNPDVCDVELADTVLQLAFLLEDVFVMHGLGAISAAHTDADITRLAKARERAAKRISATR
jgi:glutamate-1-semialdehyde 2,1-aminomutase